MRRWFFPGLETGLADKALRLFYDSASFSRTPARTLAAVDDAFRPLPLLSSPHLQTVLGSLFSTRKFGFPSRHMAVRLADGDQVLVHDSVPPTWRRGDRMAVLVHGLGGSSRSGYMLRVAAALLSNGLRVVRMDLRGTGRGMLLAQRTYHGGCSADLRTVVEAAAFWSPGSPIVLIGFSLGGNIALKLAGEAAQEPVPGLERVAALAPPIDLERCALLLGQPKNRIYERHFVSQLVQQVKRRARYFPQEHRVRFPRGLTLQQFDDLHTAPQWGFRDALDYYRQAASLPYLPRIQVPAFLLTARDDPFIAVEPFETLAAPPGMKIVVEKRGGHLGFLGRSPDGGFRWAEARLVDWVLGKRHGAT